MGLGRKGSWFSSIKKTLSPISKEKKTKKSEKKGFVEEHASVSNTSIVENAAGPPPEEVIAVEMEAEPPHAASAATTTAALGTPAEAVVAQCSGISREEVAAVRIQTVFRGYLARRALWGLRGLVRLKTVVEGASVKRQTANTLKCTQRLSHLQSEITSRRIRMSEENQALQKQLLRDKEIAELQNGDEWNDSTQSKEEIEAKLLSRYEAAMRRERALAYSFSHQQPWKKPGGTTNMLFMDPTNPQWGWSWSERYKDSENNGLKTGVNVTKSEIAKAYARHQLNSAPTTPRLKGNGGPDRLRKPKPKPSPSPRAYGSGVEAANLDDDTKSVTSVKSERNGYRRRSVGGSMSAAKSAKVKPQADGGGGTTAAVVGSGGGVVKKRLSFPAKPRRHSEPPKVETSVCDEVEHAGA